MTKDVSVAAVDMATATEQMTEIHRMYWGRLRLFIWKRLDLSQAYLAEDLASETFLELWRSYFLTGRGDTIDRPFGLLCTMARSQIGQHFLRKVSTERALDFTDPVNTHIVATGHVYALECPDTVGLLREFEAAMEAMHAASKTWRDAHKDSHVLRSKLRVEDFNGSRGGPSEDGKAPLRQRLADADRHEDTALRVFRDACARVGQARAELEAVAGPNWRSSTGLPTNPAISDVKKGSYRNDRSVTHCSGGHLLDLNNTHFEEDGSRRCRACVNARYVAHRKDAPPAAVGTPEDVIDKARAMLADPAYASLSLQVIAEQVGMSLSTLRRRLRAEAAARPSSQITDPAVLAAARQLLRDPAHDALTLQQIADKAGCTYEVLWKHLREESTARRARTESLRRASLDTARAMLADPACLQFSVTQIAEQTGTSNAQLYARLPVSDLRAAAKAKAAELAPAR